MLEEVTIRDKKTICEDSFFVFAHGTPKGLDIWTFKSYLIQINLHELKEFSKKLISC